MHNFLVFVSVGTAKMRRSAPGSTPPWLVEDCQQTLVVLELPAQSG
jgi:hypothetical protein